MIEFRQLFSLPELEEVLQLQKTIWSFADIELLPLRFLVVVTRVGGHVFGAYDGAQMVGFCFAIPGVKPGGVTYLHSHMLGVLPAYHNAGIGRRLKLMQREEALGRGIQLIEWTFDPLELKNAFFNIEKLGAIVRRYTENSYGSHRQPAARRPADGPLHRGMVDRFAARPGGAGGPAAGPRSRRTDRLPLEYREASPGRSAARARDPESQRPQIPRRLRPRPGSYRIRARRRRGRLLTGAMGMKLDRITLRQIRMPLVHFFETSFGRTYEREHHPGGGGKRRRLRLGRSYGRREPVLQRGVDRVGLADAARLCGPAGPGQANSTAPRKWPR